MTGKAVLPVAAAARDTVTYSILARAYQRAERPVLRRCGGEPCACDHDEEAGLRRSAVGPAPATAPGVVHDVLGTSGAPLDAGARAYLEPRFGHDFSQVRVHTDTPAATSAAAVGAKAYTVGQHIVFGAGAYTPGTEAGRRLLAHELTHVVQQSGGPTGPGTTPRVGSADDAAEHEADRVADTLLAAPGTHAVTPSAPALRRACLPAAACAAPIAGSAEEFGASEEARERAARTRRARMAPARARAGSHGGRARQLEIFLNTEAPGLLANIHGIFVDEDLSPTTGAVTMDCASAVPPITGATKPCVFVHGARNQQALRFNTTAAPTIGGQSREDWRIETTQGLVHEIQHVVFDSSARPQPAGVTCPRSAIAHELSELSAIMSEFLPVFHAVPAGVPPGHPARTRLANWFTFKIRDAGESVQGTLHAIRCKCDCADADAHIVDTFNFTAASWLPAERAEFNAELRKPVWSLSWPL